MDVGVHTDGNDEATMLVITDLRDRRHGCLGSGGEESYPAIILG
jgi:hypothetical protein